MPRQFKQAVLDLLSTKEYVPCPKGELASRLDVQGEDRPSLYDTLEHLVQDKIIEIGDDGRIRLPRWEDEAIGILRVNRRGFGFLEPDTPMRGGALFIPPGELSDAIDGDRVRARVIIRKGRQRGRDRGGTDITGRITEVIERSQEQFAGELARQGGQWLVVPDGRKLRYPVMVRDAAASNAVAGDKVIIEMVHFPEGDYLGEGVIVKLLGRAGEPDVETQAVIASWGLRDEFPEEATRQATESSRQWNQSGSEGPWEDRVDLTEQLVFTIDPPDARDFDDAISIERDQQTGEWTLGVHIADVSSFVESGSPLDVEAAARGNSVYLPRHVIPMLPETLSNGACSLQPDVPRLTRTAWITFDDRGRVIGQRLAATVIRSRIRMTYLEAQSIIDGNIKEAPSHAVETNEYEEDVVRALGMCNELARLLLKRRHEDGMLTLELPQVQLLYDEKGKVRDAEPEDDAFTHRIIEMFMVAANEAVARTFSSLDIPLLRRIHPEPRFENDHELRAFAKMAGFNLPDEPHRRDIQALVDATSGGPLARAVHMVVLKSLTRACYSPAEIGHFALASDHYAHFTSPIRRYPDLVVHRAMSAFLDATENGAKVPGGRSRNRLTDRLLQDDRILDESELQLIGVECSNTEDVAENAERDLRSFLVLQFLMENHLGDMMSAVVTGFSSQMVFLSIDKYLAEGSVRIRDLPSSHDRADRWEPDEFGTRLVANRSGAIIGIGDQVQIVIQAVDLSAREMRVEIVQLSESPRKPMPDQQEPRRGRQRGRKGGPDKGRTRKDKSRGRKRQR
ncbi:MAG: hypothetical protein CMJ32_02420 [Phycisphaerae bacterium]|nr:hypothetical protein [Phycisphaerae bacterium]